MLWNNPLVPFFGITTGRGMFKPRKYKPKLGYSMWISIGIPWKHNYFIPCHRIYSQVANIINMTNTRLDVIPSYVQRLSCILIGCILNDMAWILIMECFRVPYHGISHGLLKCFWCAHEKIHVKTRYCMPYQKKALHNYSILNHATKTTEENTVNTAIDKDCVYTSCLMFCKERNSTI